MLMDTVLKNLKKLINSSTVKLKNMASQNETLYTLTLSDEYLMAIQRTYTFDMFSSFNYEVIANANITSDEILNMQYASDPKTIPVQYRNKVLESYRTYTINNYYELNNYYRMLNGLPNTEEDESSLIKITDEQKQEAGITSSIQYIHLFDDDDIYKLKEIGILDKIILDNPDKKYLNYLGSNKIDIATARLANNFSILKITDHDVPDEFYNSFLQIYNENRDYFTNVIYVQNYGDSYKLYDNFIGLCIMLMTIQRVISNTFKFGIQREFYDWTFIQNMYKSYNVPFIDTLPIEHHITLLKNLNNLLRYKSTDKVLFDIASLLGYERINIFKYYLIKQHKLDENEDPIFVYKPKKDSLGNIEKDENGNIIYEEDYERMYDIYFQRINMKEQNIALALQDDNNKVKYEEVILDDPYWWEDSDTNSKKYQEAYNYVETKYIGLNLMYKMTEMMFELTYAFRMILDKKDDIENIRIDLHKVDQNTKFKLFDAVIFMIALLCKHHKFGDGIITTPSKISHIYGFDFNEESIKKIKELILENPKIIDQSLIKYFDNLTLENPEDVNNMFIRIREYNDVIIDKMRKSNNIKEYNLYKDIFRISMVSDTQNKMFTVKKYDGNGNIIETPAETYLEYLKYKSPILGEYVSNIDPSYIPEIINHVTAQINDLMTSMKYIFIVNDNNNPTFKALVSLLQFFKSYTVDLQGFNIIYLFDSKYYNLFKFIEDVKYIKHIQPNSSMNQIYSDDYSETYKNLKTEDDILKFNECYNQYIQIYLGDINTKLYKYDDMYDILVNIIKNGNIRTYEYAHLLSYDTYDDIIRVLELMKNNKIITDKEKKYIEDRIQNTGIESNVTYKGSMDHEYSTDMVLNSSGIVGKERQYFRDSIMVFYDV